MNELNYALEYSNLINRTNKTGRLRETPGHAWHDDEDEARASFARLKAKPSILWVRLYQRIEGELQVIDKAGKLPEGEQ